MSFSKGLPAVLLSSVTVTLLPLTSAVAGESGAVRQLDPVVVTATLGPKTVGESLSSVTVIDEEAIRRQDTQEFKDLLRGQPGIDISGNGSFGKTTSVYTRGANSDSTVFLVDGVRLRSATSGGAPWQYFPLRLAERIEIVRGPRSNLYGADAIGGVIQAFTLDPSREGKSGWIEAGSGNFDTQEVSAGASVGGDSTRLSLTGLHKKTDGTNIFEGEGDLGFRNSAGTGRLVHELPNGGTASFVAMQSEGNSEFNSGEFEYLIRTLGFRLETPVSDYWRSNIQLSEAADEQETFSENDSVFNTKTRTARWENTITSGTHELVLGGELLVDEVSGSTEFEENSRSNAALFGQLRLNFGATDLHLSLRGDDNEGYGKQETGGVALGHAFDRSHRVRISYGTSFRAPTFNDLYFPFQDFGFYTFEGNPDLDPEEASSVEVGFGANYEQWFWDAAVYQTNVENMIAFTPFPVLRPINIDEAEIKGFELSSGFQRDEWDVALALTLVDPRDEETDNRLSRRSHQSLRIDVDRDIGQWSLGASFQANGYRYNDAGNNVRLPGFGTVDLRAGWEFAKNWNARLTVQNVTDKRYATARGGDGDYLAAGTTGFLSVRHDFY